MSSNREPMSAVDAAWLRMDGPNNHMIITSVMTFDAPPARKPFMQLLEQFAREPRVRQRVVRARHPLELPAWQEDPNFDLRAHVRRIALPRPAGEAELQQFVSERMSAPLDPSRPLWEADLVEMEHGAALVTRLHHCIGDGVALVRTLLGLAEEAPGPRPAEVGLASAPAVGPLQIARKAAAQARALAELLLVPLDGPSLLRGRLGPVKRAAWSDPVPLEAVRALAKAHDAKTNDVLMAALAGALRGYLQDRGALPARGALRSMVPVYLRGDEAAPGNHFGLVYVDLPVGEPDATRRLLRIKEQMGTIKRSAQAPVAFGVLQAFGAVSAALQQLGVELFTSKATLIATNVPGPTTRVRIAGEPVTGMMTFAPVSGRLGASATFLSYADEVRLGFWADANLLPHPIAVAERWAEELTDRAEGLEAPPIVH